MVIAASDVKGAVYCARGIDIDAAFRQVEQTGSIADLAATDKITNKELLELECDILVPCALQNQITVDNANLVRAKYVVEGANGPTTPEAEKILNDKGIIVLPDIVANVGGAVVAYFELVQDLYYYFWKEQEVFSRLENIMVKTCQEVYSVAAEKKVTLRNAAWITSLSKVVRAMQLRGWVR